MTTRRLTIEGNRARRDLQTLVYVFIGGAFRIAAASPSSCRRWSSRASIVQLRQTPAPPGAIRWIGLGPG